jgi:hypothetical protein|tara:strand:- start:861 stop:1016 length:156 start_codon:yes stop_codon:yes gene_type:complete
MKKCERCGKELRGEMISNPDLCFDCVLEDHVKDFNKKAKRELKKYGHTNVN